MRGVTVKRVVGLLITHALVRILCYFIFYSMALTNYNFLGIFMWKLSLSETKLSHGHFYTLLSLCNGKIKFEKKKLFVNRKNSRTALETLSCNVDPPLCVRTPISVSSLSSSVLVYNVHKSSEVVVAMV